MSEEIWIYIIYNVVNWQVLRINVGLKISIIDNEEAGVCRFFTYSLKIAVQRNILFNSE